MSDLEILYNYRNEANCAKWQEWTDTSKPYLAQFIEEMSKKTFPCAAMQYAIADKTSNLLIGDIFLAKKDKTLTIGCTIKPTDQKKGYAYEALAAVIEWLQERFADCEIVGLIHPENVASKNLLTKLGFLREEYCKELDSDVYCLAAGKIF